MRSSWPLSIRICCRCFVALRRLARPLSPLPCLLLSDFSLCLGCISVPARSPASPPVSLSPLFLSVQLLRYNYEADQAGPLVKVLALHRRFRLVDQEFVKDEYGTQEPKPDTPNVL